MPSKLRIAGKGPGAYDESMLSYLHGFHAGNAADVLKHSALVFCLEYLRQKEKPLLCVDTHSGAGFYDLSKSAAEPNREWENGIGRLRGRGAADAAPPPMIAAYLALASARQDRYAGSPAIMARLLRKGDRLVCFELHPREAESLAAGMAELRNEGAPAIEVRREDGTSGLKSLLPPPSRRGLVLVDPSWEEQEEYDRVPRTVEEGLRRFPEGTFIIWYPLLARPKEKTALPLGETLLALSKGKRCKIELRTEPRNFRPVRLPADKRAKFPSVPAAGSPRGMYGSALVIFNPPWTLRPALEEALPFLAKTLGDDPEGWRLDWKE